MKNLKSQVIAMKHNYGKARKVQWFAEGKVEINFDVIAPKSGNIEGEKPRKVFPGRSSVFNEAMEIKKIEGVSAKSLGLVTFQVVNADEFEDAALTINT